jgi:hypothetical protein
MNMPTDGQIRAILVRFERAAAPRNRHVWRRYRHQLACTALFKAWMRKVRIRGVGRARGGCPAGCVCSRHILEAAMLRYDVLNPHLYGERGRRAA